MALYGTGPGTEARLWTEFRGQALFETWQHQLVDAQRAEEALGLQLVYPKIEAYAARLALHIVNAVLRQEQPTLVISGKTMARAIELAAYYLWQHKLIHTHNSPDSGLAAIALKIHKYVERVGEATASRLKSGVRDLRKMGAEQIRQLMQTLANAGFGSVRGEKTEMVYASSPPIDGGDIPVTASSITETFPEQRVSTTVDEIDGRSPDIPAEPQRQGSLSPLSEKIAPVLPTKLQRGDAVEVWLDSQWVPANYGCVLHHSRLSHRTGRLDDGHLVYFSSRKDRPHKIASADLRPVQSSSGDAR